MSDWLYPIPDPYADGEAATGAAYVADSTARRFMGDQLVEYRTDFDGTTRANSIWIVGTTTTLDESGATLLAQETTSNAHGVADDSMGATTDKVFVAFVDDATGLIDTYWIVGADGSQSLVSPADDLHEFDLFMVPDQRLEPDLRDYPTADVTLHLQPVPTGDAVASVDGSELDSNNGRGSTWAAIILGDTSTAREQPIPPGDGEVTQTSIGHHTTDGAIVFDFWDETGDQFTAWDNAKIAWSGGSGVEPSMNFGFIGSAPTVTAIPRDDGGGQSSDLPNAGTLPELYREAYALDTIGGTSRGGQLSLSFDPALNPDTPLDYLNSVSATLTGVVTITPSAPKAYRQGEYRYIYGSVDDQSTYHEQGKGTPGAEYMWSQLFEGVAGRWTAVVSLQQDGDNYGGGNQCSLCVYFEPFGGVALAFAPPLRQYPREDGMAASSAHRLYPPARSTQHSNRRAGGYL